MTDFWRYYDSHEEALEAAKKFREEEYGYSPVTFIKELTLSTPKWAVFFSKSETCD